MAGRNRAPGEALIDVLRERAASCTACDLYRAATQTVFGDGVAPAPMMLVGEQPGDKEDIEGEPFVGPAGRILDEALTRAGIPRQDLYVTNAVKHFKFEQRGKVRLHKRPDVAEIKACHPWLEQEVEAVQPEIVVCLGLTAARAVLGRAVKLAEVRGAPMPWHERLALVTAHPSSILRAPEGRDRRRLLGGLVVDLEAAKAAVEPSPVRRGEVERREAWVARPQAAPKGGYAAWVARKYETS